MIHWIRSLDRVLKGEVTKPAALRGGMIDIPGGGLTFLLAILGALYGVCMGVFALVGRWGGGGASQGLLQMTYSAVKVPMLFLLTLLVTFPSLYVFNALVGCRLLLSAVLKLLIAALAVTLTVLASFGTIIAFFSLCTTSYSFMVLLNVAAFAVAGLLGMNFLLQTLHRLASVQATNGSSPQAPAEPPDSSICPPAASGAGMAAAVGAPPLPPAPYPSSELPISRQRPDPPLNTGVRAIFAVWIIVFGLVGSQMGWVLRPFIGKPDVPVTFFRSREGNFFQAVSDKIQDVIGNEQPTRSSTSGPANRGAGR